MAGKIKLLIESIPTLSTTIVTSPILIKFMTADPCALSDMLLIAMIEALAKTNDNPK